MVAIGNKVGYQMLVDGFNRRIDYLRLSVTDRCNLRCVYCMPEKGVNLLEHDDILSYEELRDFVEAAVSSGISKVRVTGGEPLVRKGVVDFIRMLAALPRLQDISLTTNAQLLEDYASDLRKAGLKRVNISIDSLDEEVYKGLTRWGSLSKALAGLRKALEVGFEPVKVNAVLMRGINDRPEDFIRLTYDYPVHVRFIEQMPFCGAKALMADSFISAETLKETLLSYGPFVESSGPLGAGPASYVKFQGALGTVGFIAPISRHFCGECNRLRLTADGKLRACLFSEDMIDVRPAIRHSKAAVEELIVRALKTKPKEHAWDVEKIKRKMFQIGG